METIARSLIVLLAPPGEHGVGWVYPAVVYAYIRQHAGGAVMVGDVVGELAVSGSGDVSARWDVFTVWAGVGYPVHGFFAAVAEVFDEGYADVVAAYYGIVVRCFPGVVVAGVPAVTTG